MPPSTRAICFARLDGYVTAGYDYTKANELQQFNFTGGLNSRTEKRQWQIDGSTTVTTQEGTDDSSRFDASGSYRRFRPERWFVQGFAGLEGNDERGLDLRGTVGAGYGRYLQQTSQHDWAAYAGIALIREQFAGAQENESVEAVFGTQYSFYRYDSPEASFDFLSLLPSLTESGRVRGEGKLRSRYEIITDLFFEISLYGSYDSEPGEEANSNSDYGLVTSRRFNLMAPDNGTDRGGRSPARDQYVLAVPDNAGRFRGTRCVARPGTRPRNVRRRRRHQPARRWLCDRSAGLHFDVFPLTWCSAQPSGRVTRAAYEHISALLLEDLQRAGDLDGLYLDLHGAMVAEHIDDARR